MKQTHLATVLALLVVGGTLAWVMTRPRDPLAGKPQGVVWRLLEEAQAGDVDGYLDCFAGELRLGLAATVQEMGSEGFAEYLRQSRRELKGVAIFDVQDLAPNLASLVVEYLYGEQTERQRLELRRIGNDWWITGLDDARLRRSLIPYGTPLNEAEELDGSDEDRVPVPQDPS